MVCGCLLALGKRGKEEEEWQRVVIWPYGHKWTLGWLRFVWLCQLLRVNICTCDTPWLPEWDVKIDKILQVVQMLGDSSLLLLPVRRDAGGEEKGVLPGNKGPLFPPLTLPSAFAHHKARAMQGTAAPSILATASPGQLHLDMSVLFGT